MAPTPAPTSAATHDAYLAQRVFGSLDGLRGLSILAVLWHHTRDTPEAVHDAFPGSRFGFLGVDLFFVISGFLIVTLLLRERERTGTVSLRLFYIRRALRIFPVYYGMLAVFALIYFVIKPHGQGGAAFRSHFPTLLLYLSNWIPAGGLLDITWSLAAEEQFYLLWPPLERFFARAAVPVVLVLIVLSALISLGAVDGFLAASFGWSSDEPAMLRQTTFAPICFGVLLAHLLHRAESFRHMGRVFGNTLAAPLTLGVTVLAVQFFPEDIRGLPRLSVQLLFTLLVAAVVLREHHGLERVLKAKPLVFVGALCYGIYLFHMIVLAFVHAVEDKLALNVPFLDLLLGGGLTIALAWLSFRYFETPFLRMKHRFEAPKTALVHG